MKTILLVMLSLIPAYSFSAEFKVNLSKTQEDANGYFISDAIDEKGSVLNEKEVNEILSKNSHKDLTRYALVPAQRSLKAGIVRGGAMKVEGSVLSRSIEYPNDHYDNSVETITILVRDFL